MTSDTRHNQITILGIESSCDDTAAAVIKDEVLLSNLIANQDIHKKYGGVIPEFASRAHQVNIVPVVDQALKAANVSIEDIDAIAYTQGPGLLGSLLVGSSFAKGLSLALNKPLLAVDHMRAHILALFIQEENQTKKVPQFPFLCLTVSGGHTQIVLVKSPTHMELVGKTLDDAAGEAFDKVAKMLGLDYPGGPMVDQYAQQGDPNRFPFPISSMPEFNYSFSGIKTAILYFLQKNTKENPNFIAENIHDICASAQKAIIEMLLDKLKKAAIHYGINQIGLAGGVSANSELRKQIQIMAQKQNWETYIPALKFCTDNAAMIAITGYYQFLDQQFSTLDVIPQPRLKTF